MKSKEFKSVAKSIADMAISNHIHNDLGSLVSLGKGGLKFELGAAPKNMEKLDSTLAMWWSNYKEKFGITTQERIELNIKYDCTEPPTNREKLALFNLASTCCIVIDDKTYTASSTNALWWQKK